MVLEYSQESWLVSNVGDVLIMEEVESFNERSWASERCNQSGLIVRNEAVDGSANFSHMFLLLKTHNEYSQILLSKVSAPVF
jgi:hypothetical protein